MRAMTEQRSLFDLEPSPWELDDTSGGTVAAVVIPTGPDHPLDYAVPEELRDKVAPGRRVRVPLGKGDRERIGYCVALEERRELPKRLKRLAGVIDDRTLLSGSMLALSRWVSEYYLCSWAQVLEAVVPVAVKSRAGTRLTTLLSVPPEVAARLTRLELPEKQWNVLKTLAASTTPLTPKDLARIARCTPGPITTLRRKGLIRSQSQRLRPGRTPPVTVRDADHPLNAPQQQALDCILGTLASGRHATTLLFGVTGSGKTEVYMRAIREALSYRRQAIVLVPEISLTPQAEARFRARFGDVAVLHSHLGDAERHWQWDRICKGETPVVVGARSAVFAPTPQLGLIIVDEEHEASFKQEQTPRYHARDVALARGRLEGVPVVLGSATPSLESWHRAQTGEYRLVTLPHRVFHRPLPDVLTVDLRADAKGSATVGAISRQLTAAMRSTLEDGGQVILLLNRRGFATHVQCPACGEVLRCPNCAIPLTHHRHSDVALCHYCEYSITTPRVCPECRQPGIRFGGRGTQRLEAEVQARFPQYRALRMDTDSMQSPGSHEKALAAFHAGDVRILLGTQMIAKGLDFPNVTLVGVINADTALHLPDFRAGERTLQLLMQVAGRTGRGDRGGRVVVQTYCPEHPAIKAAARHAFEGFATAELAVREGLLYPPFGSMARLVARAEDESLARGYAEQVGSALREGMSRVDPAARVLGPAPAPIAKLRGQYRYHLHVQAADGVELRGVGADVTAGARPPAGVIWTVDIDPVDMM